MPPTSVIAVTVSQRALNRTLAKVRSACPAIAEKVTRAAGLAVVSEVTRSLNGDEAGYPNPKRIDTGRYRAAWNTGIGAATGDTAGRFPVRSEPGNEPQPNDGEGKFTKRGMFSHLYVRNNVRYAQYVEYGTKYMRPGGHLARALIVASRKLPAVARAIAKRELRPALKGAP